MFRSLSRGWAMTKVSFSVVRADPEILTLPLLAGVTLAGVMSLSYFGFLAPLLDSPTPSTGLLALSIFALYVVGYFIVLWFNAAVMEMATIRFNGGNPNILHGLKRSAAKSGRIFQWAIIAATVGLILNILKEMARDRHSFLGQIFASILSTAWNVLTFFVLPIAVYRDVGPISAIRQSGSLMKRTFGESVGAMFTTGLLFFLLSLPGIALAYYATSIVLLVVGFLWILAVAALSTAVNGILVAALYKYANEGVLPQAFREQGVTTDAVAW